MEKKVIMEFKGLKKYFPIQDSMQRHAASVKAIDGVSLEIFEGETLSLVGESGCGKSTTGRCAIGLLSITEGDVLYKGQSFANLKERKKRNLAKELQMIFQDPYSSLNPRMRIGEILEEPLKIHKICGKQERMKRVREMLKKVGLREDQYYRYPHEFSGGQKQRIGIARALMLNPQFIVCDEAVSALDVSIQSQILNLLSELKQERNMTYLFISHNMSVVRYISDRVGVMYLGHLMELSATDALYANPLHPYTQALLAAVPEVNPHEKKKTIKLEGDIPSPINPPSGCVFHNRCPYAKSICMESVPNLMEIESGHLVACFLYQKE